MAAPPAQPSFDAGPPRGPTPPPSGPGQRRFNFLIVGLTILLAVLLVGGLVLYNHRGHRSQGHRSQVHSVTDDVMRAYLAYSEAGAQEVHELELAPVRPFLTDAGAKQETTILQNIIQTGFRYQFTADHNPQVVVYSRGDLASVDDIMVRHTTRLDATTLTPIGSERSDTIQQSYAMKRVSGRWLIDSVVVIGTASPEPPFKISYAAASGGKPLESDLRRPIERAFQAYWAADAAAFKNLDPAPLAEVEVESLLQQDRPLLQARRQKNQGYQIKVEHNFRVAQQDVATFWVYDTFADSSYPFDLSSGKAIDEGPPEVIREGYEFQRVSDTWKLVSDIQFK